MACWARQAIWPRNLRVVNQMSFRIIDQSIKYYITIIIIIEYEAWE